MTRHVDVRTNASGSGYTQEPHRASIVTFAEARQQVLQKYIWRVLHSSRLKIMLLVTNSFNCKDLECQLNWCSRADIVQ